MSRTYLTGEAREKAKADAAARYAAGDSVRDIAFALGYSYGLTHTLLVEAGVQLRGRGSRKGPQS